MDTSDIYYKMCSKAFPEDAKRGICLKTQDQLQEIYRQSLPQDVQDSSNIWIVATDNFHDWIFGTLPKISFAYFVSMEQLWLAFVMKQNHNKVWNGEDWVNASNWGNQTRNRNRAKDTSS